MIPDYFEAITAYRAFDVYPNGLLVGQAHAEPWTPYQPFVGRCGNVSGKGWEDHIQDGRFVSAPVFRCDCGIHALKRADEAKARVTGERQAANFPYFLIGEHYRPEGRAWGAVKLWGRIVEHKIGYRAQFAYPSELFCDDEKLAVKIASLYGVPCGFEAIEHTKSFSDSMNDLSAQFQAIGNYYHTAWLSPQWSIGIVTAIDFGSDDPTPDPISPAPPQAVGASSWQQRQRQQQAVVPGSQGDWKAIMRGVLYA